MDLVVDFNADLGEGAGHDDELLALVSSANIATGFHAGDAESMHTALVKALARGVAVGAHPSLFDRENFGRQEGGATADEIFEAVTYQLGVFQAIAEAASVRMAHVKPHGALYNMGARDRTLADAIGRAICAVDPGLMLFAPPRSQLAGAGEALGLRVVSEFFADRNYLGDGSLVPRSRPDALLTDSEQAAARVLTMLAEGRVRTVDGTDIPMAAETICLHGDTPGAVDFARTLRRRMKAAGVQVRAPRATR